MEQQLSDSRETLPFSNDAEKAVLGAILRDPDSLVVVEGLLVADYFFVDSHRKIYACITDLSGQGEPVDIVTVADKLSQLYESAHHLGPVYLLDLTDSAPLSENIEYYANIVRRTYFTRRVIHTCEAAIKRARQGQDSVDSFIEEVEKEFLEISASKDRVGLVNAGEVLESTISEIQRRIELDGVVSGVPTGFQDIDQLTGGLQPSDLVILAARPGMGKTALALNLASHAAFESKKVAVFTLEMSKEQLMSRVLSSVARIDSARLTKGDLGNDELDRLMEGARRVFEVREFLAIDETPGVSLMELRSRCRRFKREQGLDLIIIDYLQLMSGEHGAKDSREREISKISMGLKELAKELKVPVVALAQLNRGPDARPDKRPKISDLRESGSMEQDADLIVFVYRDEYYNPDSESAGIAEVIVAKNRHGSTCTVKLAFQPNYVSFQNLYKGE